MFLGHRHFQFQFILFIFSFPVSFLLLCFVRSTYTGQCFTQTKTIISCVHSNIAHSLCFMHCTIYHSIGRCPCARSNITLDHRSKVKTFDGHHTLCAVLVNEYPDCIAIVPCITHKWFFVLLSHAYAMREQTQYILYTFPGMHWCAQPPPWLCFRFLSSCIAWITRNPHTQTNSNIRTKNSRF